MPAEKLRKYLISIGIEPRDIEIYRKAFTHISVAREPSDSYERLEFLGDSIIGMVISDYLCSKFPQKEEGELTRIKASVVSRETLGMKAKEIGLGKFLKVDTARVRDGGSAEVSILSDCFEGLVGAYFIDRKYGKTRKFILNHLADECLKFENSDSPKDFKSRLQELWQHEYKRLPEYVVVKSEGPDHSKTFFVEVRYEGKLLGKGRGSSKKRAEQEAAKDALIRLEKEK